MTPRSVSLSLNETTPLTANPNSKRVRLVSRKDRFVNIVVFLLACFLASWFVLWICIRTSISCNEEMDPLKALEKQSAIDSLRNGAVASDHEICSEVGKTILVDGGNAVDAAVATTLCLGVANPASSGLGGGAFILIHSDADNHYDKVSQGRIPRFHDARDATRTQNDQGEKITEVIDCREIAPGAATTDMFISKPTSASSFGGLSIAVPGELRGLELAHARHGKLAWADLVQPAIDLAKNGVPVSKHLASDIKEAAEIKVNKYGQFPRLRRFLTRSDNWQTYLKEGQLLKNSKLANTLSLVAELGSDGLYGGEMAKNLVNDVAAEGGILAIEDLSNYIPTLRSPLIGSASGFTLVGVPPPSSGGATLIGAARFLSGYASPLASAPETLSVHRTVEALRHAFAIRMSLCDPDFDSNKSAVAVEDLIKGPYMEELRRLTLDNCTLPLSMYGGPKWAQLNNSNGIHTDIKDAHEGDRRRHRLLARTFGYLEDFGTSHLSVVDKDGNAVAITSSVNQILGSYVFSNSTGILLGNTMDGTNEGHYTLPSL